VVRDVCAKDRQIVEALNREIERIDFGIRGMQIVQSSQGPSAEFDHDDLGIPLPIGLESHGTRQFVRIYPVLARAPCFAISLRFWQGCRSAPRTATRKAKVRLLYPGPDAERRTRDPLHRHRAGR
jgi:hypothetical protein